MVPGGAEDKREKPTVLGGQGLHARQAGVAAGVPVGADLAVVVRWALLGARPRALTPIAAARPPDRQLTVLPRHDPQIVGGDTH